MRAIDVIASKNATDEEKGRALAEMLAQDLEIASLVTHFTDCRNLGIPVDIHAVVEGASSDAVAEEAASLMAVADCLLQREWA